MKPLLRSRKQCFYCGQKSSKALPTHTRRWQCASCQAVNYLDENGDITDPPAEEVASSRQGAQRFARPASDGPTDSTLFCSTCLKNQQILTQLLSNYLPPPTDPNYAQREAQYPQYKRGLEERYPQVCVNCEPRVRERIRQSGYEAKTDHLKRLMQRSRQRRIAHHYGWRSLLVRAGGIGQLVSVTGYFCWSLSVILAGLGLEKADLQFVAGGNPAQCTKHLLSGHVSEFCVQEFSSLAGWSLMVGLLTIWWNPKWHHKLDGREGRLVGLTQYYYRLQGPALALRFIVWLSSQLLDNRRLLWIAQVVSAPIILTLTALAAMAVKIDKTPIVSWQMDVPPLLPNESSRATMIPSSSLTSSHYSHASTGHGDFPVSSLAPAKVPDQQLDSFETPTVSEADAMEWEPSQTGSQNFHPTSYAHRFPERINEPNPFFGRLPPPPTNRLMSRNPQAVPPPKDSMGLAPGHFDKPPNPVLASPTSQQPEFAPPTFFPAQDHDTDTGLESIFGKVFSLGEDTLATGDLPRNSDVKNHATQQSSTMAGQPIRDIPSSRRPSELHLVAAFTFSVLLTGWVLVGYLKIPALQLKLIMIASIGAAAALLLAARLFPSQGRPEIVAAYFVETLCAALLTGLRYEGANSDGGRMDHLVTALLAWMIGQEIFFSASTSLSSSHARNIRSEHINRESVASGSPNSHVHQTAFQRQGLDSDNHPSNLHESFLSQPSRFSRRSRTESIESSGSDSDASSITSTVTGVSIGAPGIRNARGSGSIPGLGFGSLRLDESGGALGGRQRLGTANSRSGPWRASRRTRY